MALAGAGNPVGGSNPAGVGSSIHYVGNHAYAYSGIVVGSGGNETTLLQFDTGPAYIKGIIQFNQGSNTGENIMNRIYFDEQIVQQYLSDNTSPQFREAYQIEIVIPPYTVVKCTCDNVTDTGSVSNLVAVTGRVYA